MVLSLLKIISRMAIQPLQHNDYFADTIKFLVMAVFPVVTPWKNGYRTFAKTLRLKKKTPRQNIVKVRMAIVKSPRRSVRRHSAAIGLFDCSVWRILHKDLNFHPYKIANVQELNDRSISHQYSFSKMEQQSTQQGHQWVFCGKYFHNMSFSVAAMFHGRHVRLISPPVITFYGGISKAEFSSLNLEP